MVKEELRRRKNKKSAESVGLENQLSRKINDNVTDPDPINNSNITQNLSKINGIKIDPGSYWLTRIIFLRYLSFIYFIAFLVSYNQNKELIGNSGLTPARNYLLNGKNYNFIKYEYNFGKLKNYTKICFSWWQDSWFVQQNDPCSNIALVWISYLWWHGYGTWWSWTIWDVSFTHSVGHRLRQYDYHDPALDALLQHCQCGAKLVLIWMGKPVIGDRVSCHMVCSCP